MRARLYTYLFLVLAGSTRLAAQDALTVDDAIKAGLEKNYAVLIVKNQQEIAKAQNNLGAAGMSPTVTLNGALNAANINSHQEFNTGVVQDRPGASSNNLGLSVNAAWTVFDGMRMFAVKKRLDLAEDLSAIQLRQQMENTIYSIILAYYDVVRIDELIKAGRQNLAMYTERKKIAQVKMEAGSASNVDFLLSQSDENRAKSDIVQMELQLLNAKTNMNNLLARPAYVDFKTADSIVVNYNPTLEDLKKISAEKNSSILASRQNETILAQTVKEARAANLPWVQLLGSYNFTRAQSQAGIVFLNRQAGFSGGLTASWLIFNGTRNSRLVKERNLLLLNQKYTTDQTALQVDAVVYVNYKSFLMNKTVLDLE